MNTKYVLPASFAATVHAFVLFGLPGKPPATATAPDPAVMTPLPSDVIEVPLEPPPVGPVDGRPLETSGPGVPSLPDIPPLNWTGDVIFVPPTPRLASTGPVTTIPLDWTIPGPGPDRISVVEARFLDHEPRARVQPAPDYPYEARAKTMEGTVVIEFRVDEAGNVYAPLVRSATSPVFVDAALRAVAKWKFEPGTRNGRPVRFRMVVPIVFRVDAA